MTTAILIPSLNRPQNLQPLIERIEAATPEPHTLYFAVSDEESIKILSCLNVPFLNDSEAPDHRYVTRMNKLIRYLTVEDSIFFGSDDVIHHPGWLAEGLNVLDAFSLAVVNDLRNQNGTQALIRRDWLRNAVYDAPGDAFHHGYQHNFADNEQFFTAYMQHQYARAMDSHVEHLHPIFRTANAMKWDETYENAGKGWEADQALYEARVKAIEAKYQ